MHENEYILLLGNQVLSVFIGALVHTSGADNPGRFHFEKNYSVAASMGENFEATLIFLMPTGPFMVGVVQGMV